MLCSEFGRFLFEARPDLFPEGCLTDCEKEIWGYFYEERNAAIDAMRQK